jgi:hypothetical protein
MLCTNHFFFIKERRSEIHIFCVVHQSLLFKKRKKEKGRWKQKSLKKKENEKKKGTQINQIVIV